MRSLPGHAVFVVPLLFDSLAGFTRVLALGAGILFILLAWHDMPVRHAAAPLRCVAPHRRRALSGRRGNGSGRRFLALELGQFPTYILLYLPRHDHAAQEASIKHLLLASSGALLCSASAISLG